MVDHPPERQIKIKIAHPEAHREEPVQEYVYHWERIIGALAALLLVLGALGYGLYAWRTPSTLPAEAEIQDRHMPEEMVVAGPPQPTQSADAAASLPPERLSAMVQAGSPVETQSVDITDAPVRKKPDAMRSPPESLSGLQPEHSPIAPGEITPPPPAKIPDSSGGIAERKAVERAPPPDVATKTTMPPTVRQEAAPAVTAKMSASQSSGAAPRRTERELLSEPVSEPSAADTSEIPPGEATELASEPESSDVVADSSASEHRGDEVLLRSPNTSIASPAVKRFLLAKDIVGNEPEGDIGDIALNDDGYAAVSSFSEVIDQTGETLQYRWLHEGKEVLRIRVPVGSNRWRSHSTKRIFAGMKGGWRAELRNSAGELLASIDFTL